jgi:hypothetical protein
MSEAPEREAEESEGPASTPFDNPWFLPVLLWIFAGWFFWDAWIEPLEEWLRFNRYGFGFLFGLAAHATLQAVRPVPYLFAGLLLVWAAWLAWMGWFASAPSWYNDDRWAVLFNRWGAGFFALAAGVSALRARRRLRAAPAA